MNVTAPVLLAQKITPKTARLKMFGILGPSQDAFGPTNMIDADMVSKELDKLGPDVTDVELLVQSKGGSAHEGLAIQNLIKGHPAKFHGKVLGVAASAMTIVLCGCDTVEMPANGQYMIHVGQAGAYGTEADLLAGAAMVKATNDSAVLTYVQRTGLPESEIRDMMAKTTWLLGHEAKAKNFIDTVTAEVKLPAVAKSTPAMQLHFRNEPTTVALLLSIPSEDDPMSQTASPVPADSTATASTPPAPIVTAPAMTAVVPAASSAAPVVAPTLSAVDRQAIEADAIARDGQRRQEIDNVFLMARVPTDATFNATLDLEAKRFRDAPTMTAADARTRALELVCHRNQVPATASAAGATSTPQQKIDDGFAAYREEFKALGDAAVSMKITEADFIRTRCIDDGVTPPAVPSK